MEPITLIIIALLASAAGAAIMVEILSWGTVDTFVVSRSVANGSANIIKKRLESGRYQVVVGVFGSTGGEIYTQSWNAGELDVSLVERFGSRDAIQIKT